MHGQNIDFPAYLISTNLLLTVGHLLYAYPINQPNEATEKGGSARKLYGPLQQLLPPALSAAARVRGGCSQLGSGQQSLPLLQLLDLSSGGHSELN